MRCFLRAAAIYAPEIAGGSALSLSLSAHDVPGNEASSPGRGRRERREKARGSERMRERERAQWIEFGEKNNERKRGVKPGWHERAREKGAGRRRMEKEERQDDFLRETILHGLVCLEKIMEPSFDGYRFFSPSASAPESSECERESSARYCAPVSITFSLSLSLYLPLSFSILENVKMLKNRRGENGIKAE